MRTLRFLISRDENVSLQRAAEIGVEKKEDVGISFLKEWSPVTPSHSIR